MLHTLYFKQQVRCIKPGTFVHFYDGVNLLVGDQGCGKSTVLQIICTLGGVQRAFWKHRPVNAKDVAILAGDQTPMRVFAHDFENDSARTAPSFDTMGMLGTQASLAMITMSHGEASLAIGRLISELKDQLIILDEPDAGLSPRSVLTLADSFKKAAANGCQIDGKMVPLDHHIENGQVVEILTVKDKKKPSRDWLDFVKTSAAKYHIRRELRHTEFGKE
jgi:predicted ATPase